MGRDRAAKALIVTDYFHEVCKVPLCRRGLDAELGCGCGNRLAHANSRSDGNCSIQAMGGL